MTAEPGAEARRGSPGPRAPGPGVGNTTATWRCPARQRGCGEGGCSPARTSAIPYSPGSAASAYWGESWELLLGQKVTVPFFFFFFT